MSFRDKPINDIKVPLSWTAGVALIVALVIGVAFLVGDRRETLKSQAFGEARSLVDNVSAPVGGVLSAPGRWAGGAVSAVRGYIFAGGQNRDLRQQIVGLNQWRDKAEALENENARLRAALGLKTDPPIPMVTALVIADVRGPFADTRLANAGAAQGVAIGNPVISEHGLVGRVLGVGHGVSRILLLTDPSSKVPVMIGRSNARAILTGDGSDAPRLEYLRGEDPVKVGDRLLTSGDGGLFPRGLPVGIAVRGLDGAWRVRLDSDAAPVDYVRILKFVDFSELADDQSLSSGAAPPLSPKAAAEVQAQEAAPPSPASGAPSAAESAAANAVAAPDKTHTPDRTHILGKLHGPGRAHAADKAHASDTAQTPANKAPAKKKRPFPLSLIP